MPFISYQIFYALTNKYVFVKIVYCNTLDKVK